MRYASAPSEAGVTASRRNADSSPVATLIVARTRPPQIIWMPVASSGRPGRTARCEAKSEPLAHEIGEAMSAARPSPSSAPAPPNADGPIRIATPPNPTTMPTPASRGSRSPRKTRPRIATQTGIMAISRAAMPDGTVCSPNATIPIPPPSSRAPTIALSRHSRADGRLSERRSLAADHVSRTAPAIRNRVAAMRNGGIESTAIAIPR